MKTKRFLAVLLAALMVCGSVDFAALAEDEGQDLLIEEAADPVAEAEQEAVPDGDLILPQESIPEEEAAPVEDAVPMEDAVSAEEAVPAEDDVEVPQDVSEIGEITVDSIEILDVQEVDPADQDPAEVPEAESGHATFSKQISLDTSALPADEDLYEAYIDQVFDVSGIQTYANNGRKYLSGNTLEFYERLRAVIEQIAAGEQDTSEVILDNMDEFYEWSYEELGLEYTADEDEILDAVETVFLEEVDLAVVLEYILVDCPFDFYWYDKTNEDLSISIDVSFDPGIDLIDMNFFEIDFPVSEDYQGEGEFQLNTEKTSAANRAVENAQVIAAKYADAALNEKLTAYKDEICALVSYDEEADAYGDSYQMVYVFDEDPETNVVCEGYSKAFQYLCDLDSGGATCYLVQGPSALLTEEGELISGEEHMWNLVRYDGCTYLADVTNSDEGAIGEKGQLFLASDPYEAGLDDDGYPYYVFQLQAYTSEGEPVDVYLMYQYDEGLVNLVYPLSVLMLGTGEKINIEDCEITLSEDEFVYSGSAQEPAVTVVYNDEHATLEEGVDYTVSYENNTEIGTASVTVTGIGNCTGEQTVEFAITELPIDFPYFWDENFMDYISENFDLDDSGTLSPEEIDAVTEISVRGGDDATYYSLEGIQYFTSLRVLTCGYNVLPSLDLSGMSTLEELYCNTNYVDDTGDPSYTLTELNLSGCTSLKVLNCENNNLTWIDLSDCTELITLYCGNNQLYALDLENNPNLEQLQCYGNQLTSLDVSNMQSLYELQCWENQLTSLDVSANTALTTLNCSENQLTSLDVTSLTALTTLICGSNYLTELDLSNNTLLGLLDCSINGDAQMVSLDISNNPRLIECDCTNLQLTELITGDDTYDRLTTLNCSVNMLSSLDLSVFPELQELNCSENLLTSLDVSCCEGIENLYCNENNLTSLILGDECEDLGRLDCSWNQLESLDLSGAKWLGVLQCSNNELTELDLSANKYLTGIQCEANHLTELDLSHCEELFDLDDEDISEQQRDVIAYVSEDAAVIDLTDLVSPDHIGNISMETRGAELSEDKILIGDLSEESVVYGYAITAGDVTGVMHVTLNYTVDITGAAIALSETDFTYDGVQKTPDVTLSIGDTILEEGVDYKVSYTDNVSAGTAAVTVTGRGKYTGSTLASFVIEKADQSVKAVLADETIEAGSKTVIKDSGTGEISYESDNPSVATVDQNGFVTGVKAGTATITVTAAGNENYNAGSATVTITVTEDEPETETETETETESESEPDTNPADATTTTQLLLAKGDAGKKSVSLSWNKVQNADGYIVYGGPCGGSMTKLTTVSGRRNTSWTQKKLTAGSFYKYKVKAYKLVNGKQKVLKTSNTVHVATNGKKYTNVKSVKVSEKSVTLRAGKTKKITASYTLADKNKKLKKHMRTLKFVSSDPGVAKVSSKGKITAVKKGTCKIYVYASNGARKGISVTVKK